MLGPVTTAGAAGLVALIRPVFDSVVHHLGVKVEELATHVGGGILHEKYREIERHVRERIPGFSGFPANHDVRRAVRLAQLQALEYLLNDYEKSNPPEWKADPINKPKWFLDTARTFVRSQRPLLGEIDLECALGHTDAIDATEKTIVEAFARSRMPQGASDKRLRVLAEDAVLDELKANLSGIVLPEDFQRRFRSKAPPAIGWFTAFTLCLAEQVKENDRFHRILVTDLLAELTQLGLETQDIVRALDATIDRLSVRFEDKIDAMEDENERRHRQQMAATEALRRGNLQIATTTNKTDGAIQLIAARLDQVFPLRARSKEAGVGPVIEKGVADALATAEKGAAEGDERCKIAVVLFNSGKGTESEFVFRALAEDKERASKKAAKDAATAFRNLGAIIGLRDPRRALDAYKMALRFDPDDWESMLSVGSIQQERGTLSEAETHFRYVLSLDETDKKS
jgi:tetratricopeptide (TPR) repeat protein